MSGVIRATYLAEGRLRPMVQMGIERGSLRDADMDLTNEVIDALPELLGRAGEDRPLVCMATCGAAM